MTSIYEISFGALPMEPTSNIVQLTIKYEGLKESEHEIELASLATSWQGLAKLLNSVTQMSCYGQLGPESSKIKITTKAELKPGSILTDIYIKVVELDLFSGSGTAIITAILGYLFAKAQSKKDITQLVAKLQSQLEELKETIDNIPKEIAEAEADKLIKVIHYYEPSLRKYCRSFLEPIVTQCNAIKASSNNKEIFTADEETKNYFRKKNNILNNQEIVVELRKIDKKTGTGTVIMYNEQGEEEIVKAQITDELFEESNNEYLDSFANRMDSNRLKVLAQKIVDEEGNLVKINIQQFIELVV